MQRAARGLGSQVVEVGASAGGLQALLEVLLAIPPEFPAIVVVQHLDPVHKSMLADLLARKTGKRVQEAEDGQSIKPDTVYIGPPNSHLLVRHGRLVLTHSAVVNFSRPSIDLMFESVAENYGARAIGVILSGSNRDGSAGIRAIHAAGGRTVAQDPRTAEHPVMPQYAINTGCVDSVVPIGQIGVEIMKLFNEAQVQ